MPFVTCPDCRRESMAPRDMIGLVWACPKCGESFVVRDDDGPRAAAPRRRRKPDNTGRWVALGVLLVATVAAAAWAGVRWARPPVRHVDPAGEPVSGAPPVEKPLFDFTGDGPDWTYREMLEYLRSRGLVLKLGHYRSGQFFMFTDRDGDVTLAEEYLNQGILYTGTVTFIKTRSAKDAREAAGRHEDGTFAWGRWCFMGNEKSLDKIRRALAER